MPATYLRKTQFRQMFGYKISQIDWLLYPIYETAIPKTILLLRHGDSFILPLMTFLLYSLKGANHLHSHKIPVKV